MNIKQLKLVTFLLLLTFNLFAQTGNWKLVWADEFNYTGSPDPTKWTSEGATRRNKEAQIYTDRPKNEYVSNGMLTLTAYKEEYANPRYSTNSMEWYAMDPFMHYTSGSIITRDKASWQYGKIEVRGKIPKGNGTWPTVWLMGIDKQKLGWPRQGEVDIMEAFGRNPYFSTGTLHYALPVTFAHFKTGDNLVKLNKPVADDFHIYGVEWDSKHMTLFFDNKPFFTYPLNESMVFTQQPFYLIINLAIGGTGGGPIDDSIFPAKFLIDYVRVYQK
jgi:beta-glucanase (GH16 family)